MLIKSKNINMWINIFQVLTCLNIAASLVSIEKWYCFIFILLSLVFFYLIQLSHRVKRLQNFEFANLVVEWKNVKNKTPYILLNNANKENISGFSLITKDDMTYNMKKLYESQSHRLGFEPELVLSREEASKLLKEEGYHEI